LQNTKKTDLRLLRFFWEYVVPYRKWIWASVLALPFGIATTLFLPWLIVHIIDVELVKTNTQGLLISVGAMAGAVLVGYLADGVYTYSLQRAGQMAIADLRKDLFRHCLALPRKYYDKNPVGKVLSRLTSDMEALGESIAVGVLSLFADLIKTIGLFFFLIYLSWQLTLVVLALLIPVYLITLWLKKKLRLCYNETRESLAEATSFLAEVLSGVKTVQLYNAEIKCLNNFKDKNQRFMLAQNRSNVYDSLLYSLIEGLTSVAMAALIWYGTGQILAGLVSIGVLVGFINTLNRIFIPIREFAQQLAMIQRAFSALSHILDLFGEEPEVEEAQNAEIEARLKEFETLEFKGVRFRYDPSGEEVLKGIDLTLKRGQRLALVGTTGSGKSTLIRLIFKSYTGYTGSIKINGIELDQIPRRSLIHLTSLMQQEVYLFNETLGFNIELGQGLDPKSTEDAARAVHAWEFIEAFPGQLEHKVVDGGKNLSAGQAQLISFARAMAKPSALVLLDEATSSVDSITEALIQKATARLFEKKTVIAIAHRLSTIKHSDQILVLKGGLIVEQGQHQELLARGGHYAELLNKLDQAEEGAA